MSVLRGTMNGREAVARAQRPFVGRKQPFTGFRFRSLPETRTVSPMNLGEIPNSAHSGAIFSPSSRRATNRSRSSMT